MIYFTSFVGVRRVAAAIKTKSLAVLRSESVSEPLTGGDKRSSYPAPLPHHPPPPPWPWPPPLSLCAIIIYCNYTARGPQQQQQTKADAPH